MFSNAQWEVLQNPNVQRILIFCFIDGACFSLWNMQVFPVLVHKLSGDTTVGWIAAVSGIAQMIAAVSVGFTNTTKRENILRIAAFNGFCAVCLSLCGVAMLYVPLLFFASTLWGAYSGIVATGSEALFADSVLTGKRDFVYNLKWVNQTLCVCVGSLTSLFMLLHLGNEWSTGSLQTVMFIGLILHPIAHVMLLTMKDKYALVETTEPPIVSQCVMGPVSDEAVPTDASAKESRNPEPNERSLEDERESVRIELSRRSAARRERYVAAQEGQNVVAWYLGAMSYYLGGIFDLKAVPYLVCIEDFLVSFGSGMTVRYIPLFFVNDHDTSPVTLMSAYIITSFVQALLASIVRYAGEWYINRVTAVIITRVLGAMLLMIMGIVDLHLAVLMPIYIIRTASMNSTQGVTRSIIMDCVEKEDRAKWSALESFSSFTWAGSAVIGGYLAEARGYKFTFLITAIIHFSALLILVPAIHGSREVERVKRRQLRLEREERRNQVVVEEFGFVDSDSSARSSH